MLHDVINAEENPFLAIRNAAYRKHAGGGPSHGHRQYAQKFGNVWFQRYPVGQTDRHRQTHSSQYFATALVGEVTIYSALA